MLESPALKKTRRNVTAVTDGAGHYDLHITGIIRRFFEKTCEWNVFGLTNMASLPFPIGTNIDKSSVPFVLQFFMKSSR